MKNIVCALCRASMMMVFAIIISISSSISSYAQLRLYAPNGGEKLMAGSSFLIRWGGVNFADSVSLEYSTDGGVSWLTIKNNVTGVSYLWNPVPSISNTQCLVRVTKSGGQSSGILPLIPKSDNNRGGYVEFSPDESHCAYFKRK